MSLTKILTADDLAAFVEERCSRHWNNTRQALLLTTLGTEALASMDDKTLLKRLGGIKSFIDNNVKSLRVITHKSSVGKHGVVPADADIPENTDFLFTANSGPLNHQSSVQLSYHPGLWKAFKNPVKPGCARVWSFSTPHSYTDIPMGQPIPEKSIEIPERFVIGIDGPLGPVNAATLRDNIRKFIAERDLEESSLISKPTPRSDGSEASLESTGQSVDFATALARLSKLDQSRISIPLDIVMEMFRAR
ncbi:hypothetical protein [Agrobacterium larrymoorei]|uniref:hypothetical protein n=1 Tax=Agrobacterium larrymoorei TaxID=160699 RepID=UPI0030BC86D5